MYRKLYILSPISYKNAFKCKVEGLKLIYYTFIAN